MHFEDRFWNKVRKTDSCWIWTSATSGSLGYGFFWVGGKKRSDYAHRLSWKMANGEIPNGLLVLHHCDNPLCVNPSHLFLGTYLDNKLDAVSKKRHAFGERNGGGRKLTWAKAKEIRESKGVLSISNAARNYGVSMQTIKAIRRGDLWSAANAI